MDLTTPNVANLFKGFRVLFDDALQAADTDYQDVATRTTSSSAEELYAWLGAIPSMKEMLGELVLDGVSNTEWTIRNRKWAEAVEVPREAIERDSYGIYNPLMSSLGRVAAQHPDALLAELFKNAFSNTQGKDYTGFAFFAANKRHEPGNSKSAVFSNNGTGVLNEANLIAAVTNLKTRKNNAGRSMKLGRKLLLVVPPALEFTAKALLQNEKNAAGADNILRNVAQVKVLADLESPTAWFLMETGLEIKPFIFQVEVEPQLTSLVDPANPHTFMTDNFVYKAYGRYNMAYGIPQLCYGSTGAG